MSKLFIKQIGKSSRPARKAMNGANRVQANKPNRFLCDALKILNKSRESPAMIREIIGAEVKCYDFDVEASA